MPVIAVISTQSPSGQQVSVSWPDLNCLEGLTQPTCTFTPLEEGTMPIRAIATDDDGEETEVISSIEVLNVAPTIGEIGVWIAGVNTPFDANGTWVLKRIKPSFYVLKAMTHSTIVMDSSSTGT